MPCQQIYVWCGNKSNRFERLKANELAIAIRDTEMSGRGEKEIIDEGSEPEKLIEVSYLFIYLFFNRLHLSSVEVQKLSCCCPSWFHKLLLCVFPLADRYLDPSLTFRRKPTQTRRTSGRTGIQRKSRLSIWSVDENVFWGFFFF